MRVSGASVANFMPKKVWWWTCSLNVAGVPQQCSTVLATGYSGQSEQSLLLIACLRVCVGDTLNAHSDIRDVSISIHGLLGMQVSAVSMC